MRRFLLTSPAFTGEAEMIFNHEEKLIRFDVSKTNMRPETVRIFKEKIPVMIGDMNTAFEGTRAVVVEQDFEISLDDFKREYPYSRNFHLLTKRWDKLTKTEQVQAYYAAIEYRKYCKRNDWYKPKIADSWLANKEYLNDWKKM